MHEIHYQCRSHALWCSVTINNECIYILYWLIVNGIIYLAVDSSEVSLFFFFCSCKYLRHPHARSSISLTISTTTRYWSPILNYHYQFSCFFFLLLCGRELPHRWTTSGLAIQPKLKKLCFIFLPEIYTLRYRYTMMPENACCVGCLWRCNAICFSILFIHSCFSILLNGV